MVDNEEKRMKGGDTCDAIEGGYSIFLEGETIRSFMESGDFSSARELDHFREVETQVEKWLKEEEGVSLLALSANENRLSRDFSVLQIAHLMAKHGRTVLIVDCDFLCAGLSGLVENPEDYGFLDLLLYGSSLQSISHPTGIDGVSVAGPGSFPVSRTVPFALSEFTKVENYLTKHNDAVIYCSTLYTGEGTINPLCTEVDGIILCCRIEEMEEGQLQRSLADLGSKVPPVDLICFCDRKEGAEVPAGVAEGVAAEAAGEVEVQGTRGPVQPRAEVAPGEEEEKAAAYIEKAEEIEEPQREDGSKFNIPRIVTIAVAVIIVSFIVWWVTIDRSIRDKHDANQRTELVQKQRNARERAVTEPAEHEQAESVTGIDTTGAATTVPDTQAAVEQQTPGVGEVREEPQIAEEARPHEEPAAETTAVTGGRFAIHVASFRNITRAGTEKERLEKKGFDVSIVAVDIKGQEWFRIFVGRYSTREEAMRARTELLDRTSVGYAQIVKLKERN